MFEAIHRMEDYATLIKPIGKSAEVSKSQSEESKEKVIDPAENTEDVSGCKQNYLDNKTHVQENVKKVRNLLRRLIEH